VRAIALFMRPTGAIVAPMTILATWPGRILIGATAAGAIGATALTGGVAMAAPATPLPCSASMSNSHPKDYTTTKVQVHTATFAAVKTVAHYRTTNTTHRGTAGHKGNLSIPYYISGATPGFKVKVSVTVKKGSRTGSCSTSFTPHA
jgi:hypothetical protein